MSSVATMNSGTLSEVVTSCQVLNSVAANRHPGQVGYALSPPREVGDEESSL